VKALDGKRALVTGGTRGLGLAIAKAFAAEGARVAISWSKNDEDAEEAKKEIGSAIGFKGSVADAAHVGETVAALEHDWGGIDVLVNAAGTTQIRPIALIEEADWDRVLAVNLKGAFLCSRAVLKGMIRRKQGGAIVNLGSFASERMIESPVHYAASKSALRGFTEALALEVGRYGIRVNLLAPGLTEVGLSTMLPQHRIDEYREKSALGRVATADEIARLAVFLAADASRFMTGAKLVADGGL